MEHIDEPVILGRPPSPRRSRTTLPPLELGPYLRLLREQMMLSREKAAPLVPLSAAYLAQLETSVRWPTREALDRIAAGYRLDEDQKSHLRALHAPSSELVSTADLRHRISQNRGLMQQLADFDARGVIAAYLDPTWSVLAANESFRRALPGWAEADAGVGWFLTPTARGVLIEWKHEVTLLIRFLKGDLARYRRSARTAALLELLGSDEDLYRLWRTDSGVARERLEELMLLRDETGEQFSVSVQTGRLDTHSYVRHVLGIRKPHSHSDSE